MDAYDEGSNGRQAPDAPPDGPAPARRDTPGAPDIPSTPDTREVSTATDLPNAPDASNVPGGLTEGEPTVPAGTAPGDPPAPTGIAALSPGYQIAAALALAVVAVTACVHLGMVFLHLAPSNTVTKQHGTAIEEWIYPEFEQNWKLFAPNPLQQNIAVQVRAQVRTPDGTSRETGWYDLSALDGAAIDGNLLPSHTDQNELRRSWDFYVSSHDAENRPSGMRGDLSERYLRRVVVLRLDRLQAGGKDAVVESVQVRSRTTNVTPPEWSQEQVSDKPMLRELPWWSVAEGDRQQETAEASAR
ncbi:DUF5819 family protein [Streptomyces sp. NBC_00620]|uniref:DUF5819 family protein n=1 Tax=unclassified Streptomyces TaxID=2593676 RepID=UPI002257FE23|nr:DUF5819 family protein [Streptomyces sp. NBC_00620]MCX4972976.1 DUF5819 family protein [Streptomyces sp. NBC_00620]WUC12577.1 DUF5819 family protein [Streptomyces sp. NBC_00564]